MAVLPIVIGEDQPILRQKTQKVKQITKEHLKLIKDMEETCKKAEGAGIAAPQVGRSERICIAMLSGKSTPLINPEIIKKNDEIDVAQEGCLSLPGKWIDIPRATEIVLRYQNTKGKEQEVVVKGWNARIIQHEVDHLDGKLIVDY